jgi:hypothetical protein
LRPGVRVIRPLRPSRCSGGPLARCLPSGQIYSSAVPGALRAWAKGLQCLEAAVELLIGNRSLLFREDFLEIAVEFGGVFSGRPMAAVDFVAVAVALEAGVLPC